MLAIIFMLLALLSVKGNNNPAGHPICGEAGGRTKKGLPCAIAVKGGGRCPRHINQEKEEEKQEEKSAFLRKMTEKLDRAIGYYGPGSTITEKPLVMAFTGHRPDKLGRGAWDTEGEVRKAYRKTLTRIVKAATEKYNVIVIVGGALGIDQDAARVAHNLGVPYRLYAPCHNQEGKWPAESQEYYQKMAAKAESITYIHDGTYPGSWVMQKRNERMVDDADVLVAVWNGTNGGTKNCVEYALAQNVDIYRWDFTTGEMGWWTPYGYTANRPVPDCPVCGGEHHEGQPHNGVADNDKFPT